MQSVSSVMNGPVDYLWVFNKAGNRWLVSKWSADGIGPAEPQWVDGSGVWAKADRREDGSLVTAVGVNGSIAAYYRFEIGRVIGGRGGA